MIDVQILLEDLPVSPMKLFLAKKANLLVF